jgi:hypothetical protein
MERDHFETIVKDLQAKLKKAIVSALKALEKVLFPLTSGDTDIPISSINVFGE